MVVNKTNIDDLYMQVRWQDPILGQECSAG